MSKGTLPMQRTVEIVFKGKTPDNTEYIIRYPKRTDVTELHRYINELSKEKTFISFQGEEISLKDERTFLNDAIKKIKQRKGLLLLVEINGKIIGVTDVRMNVRIASHIGTLGITIAKEFRGKGIGKKLLETVMAEARKLEGIRILELECFATNPVAPGLYKACGFQEYGRLPKGIAHKGGYVDDIFMYYDLEQNK